MIPRSHRAWLVFCHDLTMTALAWVGAYALRFNLTIPPAPFVAQAWHWLPWVVVIQGGILFSFRLYRGLWRFASLPDLVQIAKACLIGTAAILLADFFYDRSDTIPRSIPLLYALLLIVLLGGPRLAYRLWKDRFLARTSGKRALIVGAGRAADMLLRDLLQDPDAEYQPVLLVDDDPRKQGRSIRGIRVKGGCEKIPRLVGKYDIEVVLIAIPSATDRQMRRIIEHCEQADVPFLTLPSLAEVLNRPDGKPALRPVRIEDLLGREPARLDWPSIQRHLRGETVLVTGGGGSIGSELCRQLARLPVGRLVVFERCEHNLYQIGRQLAETNPDLHFVPVLGDVTDEVAVRRAMQRHRPRIVFHAAAYKHVPLLETQIREAVHNNVLGTEVVARLAREHDVGEFVLVSTDKAVHPANIMGASKRAAEMICQSYDRLDRTRFVTVRFGNVLDSAGSVVPLFREQIQRGGPVTVTHPEITRYFMTIPEACQLIMQAAALGEGGEIFVLDMGAPVSIRYLAEQMILLSGKRPGTDIEIRYVGLRPGEKLHEELFYTDEALRATGHDKLRLATAQPCDPKIIARLVEQLRTACRQFDDAQLHALLQTLVPEFRTATPDSPQIKRSNVS